MITEWVPAGTGADAIDQSLLQRFAGLAETLKADPAAVISSVEESELNRAQSWLKMPEASWQTAISKLEEKDLFPLAVFFTLGEMKLPGWQCGASNPAIWLFRYMKANNLLPAKEEIRSLKKLTDNRFIPYGSVL